MGLMVKPAIMQGLSPLARPASDATTNNQNRQNDTSRRNVAIDVLRGYCVVMMITSHTGTDTFVNQAIHPLRFVSGAEGFVFLAGLVLGVVYRKKLATLGERVCYNAIWRRTGMIWFIHCLLVLLAVGLNGMVFRYPEIPSPGTLSAGRLLWLTASLQLQPGRLLNILPLYVFLLGAAPLVFYLLRRKKALAAVAVSVAIFVYSQYDPGLGRWVHPISGGEAFPVLAWQVLFVPGIVLGYHQERIRRTILARYRTLLRWVLPIACAIVCVGVVIQTPHFQFYNHEAWDAFLWNRHPLRIGRVLYFMLSVSAFYLMAQAYINRSKLPRFPIDMLSILGRNSLYAFLVHIGIAFFAGMAQLKPEQWMVAELIPICTLAIVYVMAKNQIARRWIPN